MKKSLSVLAVLALCSAALYAEDTLNHAKILDLFAQYNPSVLEQAKQEPGYNQLLQGFLSSYQASEVEDAYFELIALIRNFDNSVLLNTATNLYKENYLYALMGGQTENSPLTAKFTQDVRMAMEGIWATTVQVHEFHLAAYKDQLKSVKKDKSLSKEDKAAQVEVLKEKISALKREIKNLKTDSGAQIVAAADLYVAQTQDEVREEVRIAQEKAQQAAQTKNLKISSKNKKRIAK